MSRLVIVSNRLPITIDKQEGGELIYHPSAGGLATGLNSLDDTVDRIWVGWPGKEIDNEWEQESVRLDLLEKGLIPVFLTQEEIRLYYEGFSNRTLWPHFHYFTQFTRYSETYWEAYQHVNRKFANVILPMLRKDDLVWVHDYQLMLLPAMIRDIHPDLSIGFFLHIPFPSYEIFRVLPWRRELLQGVLGADQIGFHTFNYMRHFLSAAYRITGHEHQFGRLSVGRRIVNVDVFPMGIDYEKYAKPELNLEAEDEAGKIYELASETRLIISIDRLDYSKGIPQRVRAFRRFLNLAPEYHGKVTLLMIVVPSRGNVTQYKELKEEIDTLVGKINAEYGAFDWIPIRYFYRSLNFNELSALYRVSEVALITPLRDGMNLVAKEFVASKDSDKKGVLILSEMAGASNELSDALLVNPQDQYDIVRALKAALEMDEKEQRTRLESIQNRLKKYTVKHWVNSFLNEQRKHMERQVRLNISRLDEQERGKMFETYQKASNRLIILDYDGTLMDFHKDPQAVQPDADLLQILEQLRDGQGNKLLVNSGRDRNTLQKWLGHLGFDMAAEHGVWLRKNGEWSMNGNLASSWKADVRHVLEDLVERTPGSFIEEKDYSIAWHYRSIDRDFGQKRVREFRDVLLYLTANLDLQVLEGNKVVEIKNAGVNKGKATMEWLGEREWDFIMAIGDDHTDEDTFKALPEDAYTVKVGVEKSVARYNVVSVKEVRSLLREFAAVDL